MDFDALLPQLWQRYPFLDDTRLPVRLGGIREADVAEWAASCDGDRDKVYDGFARYLAIGFHERRLAFSFCDAVINDLHAVIVDADDRRPPLFCKVFEAFDAGEFHRRHDRSDEPVTVHTETTIAAIVPTL